MLDAQEQLEMAMLDKEMAEERAETAEAELEELKERFAVAEVELKVLKEGGSMGDGGASECLCLFIVPVPYSCTSRGGVGRGQRRWEVVAGVYTAREAERAVEGSIVPVSLSSDIPA